MGEKINNAKNKTEQAKIMGIKIPEDGYWGDYSSRTCGGVGGGKSDNFTKDTVVDFEQPLVENTKENKNNKKDNLL
ncbi:MAG TPA: small, acid-soluble spore protein, alpha/beta type [Clostridium sp.]